MQPLASQYSQQLAALKVLIVDDESTMRKVTKSLLQVIGVQDIYEAKDGRSGMVAADLRIAEAETLPRTATRQPA